MSNKLRWPSLEATLSAGTRLGEWLASQDSPSLRLGLEGQLGAGKTTFTSAIVSGFDPSAAREVSSPTYALWQIYAGGAVNHLDLYRVSGHDELETLGFLERWDQGIWLIEWPSRVESLLGELDLVIVLSPKGDAREAELISLTDAGDEAAAALA